MFDLYDSVQYKDVKCVILDKFFDKGRLIYQLEGSERVYWKDWYGLYPIYYATEEELKPL